MGYYGGPIPKPPRPKTFRPSSRSNDPLDKAALLADDAHAMAGQMYGRMPYIHHLRQVVAILYEYGYKDDETIQAGYLHDTLEDTSLTMDDLLDRGFSPAVVRAVCFCTDEEGRNRKTRKAATYKRMIKEITTYPDDPEVHRAVRVKLADRLANIRNCIANFNEGLFKMYKGEEATFAQALRYPGIADEMWAEYDRLMEEGMGSSVTILE